MTWLHTRLVFRRLVPFGVKRLRETPREYPRLWKPKELWAWLVKENTSSLGLAFSAFVGALLAVYPTYFFKNETIDWQSWYFRYIVKDTVIFPEIIVYDNYKHGYRLILTVSDLFEDSEP